MPQSRLDLFVYAIYNTAMRLLNILNVLRKYLPTIVIVQQPVVNGDPITGNHVMFVRSLNYDYFLPDK